MKTPSLKLEKVSVSRGDDQIVSGVDFELPAGELHALMGPNGSGKSTLANAVMGHPKYRISGGRIRLDGRDITKWPPDERSRAGLLLTLQHPPEIPGVNVANFLRAAANARRPKPLGVVEFHELLKRKMAELKIDPDFAARAVNEGFSGGEKKRLELLQLLVLEPRFALLDEIDSGLDVDALKLAAATIEKLRRGGAGVLLITHHAQLLGYLRPDRVHVMVGGRLVRSGGAELAVEIGERGFEIFDSGR